MKLKADEGEPVAECGARAMKAGHRIETETKSRMDTVETSGARDEGGSPH